MIDRAVLPEALSIVCNADVTLQSDVTVQSDVRLGSEGGPQLLQLLGTTLLHAVLGPAVTSVFQVGFERQRATPPPPPVSRGMPRSAGATQQQQLSSKNFIHAVLNADKTSQVSRSNFDHLPRGPDPSAYCTNKEGFGSGSGSGTLNSACFIIEDEFFDQRFDYDFTNLTDVKAYTRGGEVYERPCGWQRFAIRVLDEYEDNTWLGTRYRSTESLPGEWPVSYHGTSKTGAEGIVEGNYKPGDRFDRKVYGRGIYSTPYLSVAIYYAKTFTCKKDGKKYQVMLQNRINPEYRKKYNKEKEWLVPIPDGTPEEEEQKLVERAIRPYGLLLKEA